ncbi:hypothetical protein C2G38_2224259 [Gigaspora rosea]|uniref:Uncharacterized protein n=1 Tax=Gigaspora rosea TaxID=44941 RepID=A0A397U9D1_9GLOM|nr:hypothetical protein C2G38_2224259 [Gigaspora rosea]
MQLVGTSLQRAFREAWYRICDPQKTTQGCTSGNKNIDDCIREFQLKAKKYEDKVGEEFSAIWIDGIRTVSRVYDDKGNLQSHYAIM